MSTLTYDTCQPLVGKALDVCQPDSRENLSRMTVTDVRHRAPNGKDYEAFAILLRGDPETHLPQGSYLIKHPDLGESTLFMTPNSIDEYEIVICRSLNSENQ